MIYLASPFSHPDPAVRRDRARLAHRCAAWGLKDNHMVFSPIAYTAIFRRANPILPADYESWKPLNEPMIEAAESLWLLAIDGWETNHGVAAELAFAHELEKRVLVIEYEYSAFRFGECMAMAL